MITYREALQLLEQAASDQQVSHESCSVDQALGRCLAQSLVANSDLPSFDNSAMDGYAMRSNAAAGRITLMVQTSVFAGDTPQQTIQDGAIEIMTGAPVPNWCETVVPVENVTIGESSITLDGPIKPDQNIRRAGEDVKAGELILSAGRVISAEDLMMLSALGLAKIKVCKPPVISLISTGAELVDDPKQTLQPGQIRNSNQPYLAATLHQWPVEVRPLAGHPDDGTSFLSLLNQALSDKANIIISTGAVSMGVRDFVPEALRSIGAKILFHKCKIRPGKPVLFAKMPNGSLFFGLPGNPVSAAVGFRFFVVPVLRKILGLPPETIQMAKVSADFRKKSGLRMFAKALATNVDGKMQVEILPGQQSFRIAPLLAANCWAEILEDSAQAREKEMVRIYPLSGLGK